MVQDEHETDVLVQVRQDEWQGSHCMVRLLPKVPGLHTVVQAVEFQKPSLQLRQVDLLVQVRQGLIQLSQVLLVGFLKYLSGHVVGQV
jgi:hypothetical protein